jgi:hypothetical protein
VDPKIAEEDYALLDGMAGEATDVYLELTPLPGLNPVDQFLETLYTQQELFDSGVLRKEEVFSAITEDYFAARRSRFDEIAPDLFDVPGVAPVANLQGLDFVHIKMSIDALAEIEEFP